MHITYVKYAGRRINDDLVNWYERSLAEEISAYFNTGDICVYESTLRLIAPDTANYYLNVESPVDPAVVDKLKTLNSVMLLRGSNYIHEGMNWGYFDDWLQALDLPIVVCGVGAQAETKRAITLPAPNLRVWKIISDHCKTIGVRGAFTAETLKLNGVANVEVVGCPSVFRARNRNLTLKHAAGGPKRLTFSLRREVDSNYAVNPEEFREIQKRVIAKLDLISDLYLSCHGEPEEKAFFFRAPAVKAAALAKLTKEGWFDHVTGPVLKRLYEDKLYYFRRPDDYDFYAPQFDAALGYRVHAVLPAVACGVPGILFNYDTRSEELAETFDLPIFTPAAFEAMSLAEAFDPGIFSKFETRFAQRYDRMKAFLEDNGLQTRM